MLWPKETNAVAGGDTFWTLITRVCCIILNWVHLKKSRIIFFVFVTYWQSMARFRKNDFFKWAQKIKSVFCFNPHTHEGCDFNPLWLRGDGAVSIHTPTKGVTIWVLTAAPRHIRVSIHTPTKGVTMHLTSSSTSILFQSTHPRRVWLTQFIILILQICFNPHTHEGCDSPCFCLRRKSTKFQSTHSRRVWQRFHNPRTPD